MDAELSQLAEMRQVAFDLGMAFGAAAKAEDDLDRKLVLLDAFHRSFASVRLSIALRMRIEREARRPAAEAERPEGVERPEPLDAEERPERPDHDDERDREREGERVSLPILLRTLGRVADDAGTLLPQAAELPTLRELLARVKDGAPAPSQPQAQPGPLQTPQPAAGALRARLAGSTTTLTLAPPGPLPRAGPPPHRSTGPPR